jgi:hypothetical protein
MLCTVAFSNVSEGKILFKIMRGLSLNIRRKYTEGITEQIKTLDAKEILMWQDRSHGATKETDTS